jgi:hypothetical protein
MRFLSWTARVTKAVAPRVLRCSPLFGVVPGVVKVPSSVAAMRPALIPFRAMPLIHSSPMPFGVRT